MLRLLKLISLPLLFCCCVQIRAPSTMSPGQLAAEVKRCTMKDGSIGLVSVCVSCHRKAGRKGQHLTRTRRTRKSQSSSRTRTRKMQYKDRNKSLDQAAKLARRECECDDQNCHRPVTAENLGLFEWDHRLQSFDDPDYRMVSYLVHTGASAERCDRERAKCRLLHIECHHAHTSKQSRVRKAQRVGQSDKV
jgi:hypothetical protein